MSGFDMHILSVSLITLKLFIVWNIPKASIWIAKFSLPFVFYQSLMFRYFFFLLLNFSSFCEQGIMHTSQQTHIFVKVWTLKCEPGQACLSTNWESVVLNLVVFTHKTFYSQFNNLTCILYDLWSMAIVASKWLTCFVRLSMVTINCHLCSW